MYFFPMSVHHLKPKVLNQPYIQGVHRVNQFLLGLPFFRGAGRIMQLLRNSLPAPGPDPLLLPTRWGFTLLFQPGTDPEGLEELIYRAGVYEMGTMLLMKKWIREGDFVLDIGANIGWMSLWMGRLTGNGGVVWAFEPHPDLFPRLKENIRFNDMKQIIPQACALGRKKESALLFDNPHINRGGASLIDSSAGENQAREVKVFPLDDWASRFPKAPRLIKIDVEGWELEVLKGAETILQSSDQPILILEYSLERPAHQEENELRAFLLGHGYSIWHQKRGKERWSRLVRINAGDPFPEHDNLICLPARETGGVND
jgi:FkbM family methyltransferase